jgi:4'-phosphopantetheinyl transferase EntD
VGKPVLGNLIPAGSVSDSVPRSQSVPILENTSCEPEHYQFAVMEKSKSMFQEIPLPKDFIHPSFSDITFVAAEFDEEVDVDTDPLLSRYSKMVSLDLSRRRRAEFYAGRLCAARALRRLGCSETLVLPSITPLTHPTWPIGTVGSISHTGRSSGNLDGLGGAGGLTRGIAVSAAALCSYIRCLGVDIEEVVSEDQARDMQEFVIGQGEIEQNNVRSLLYAELFTLLFSAKECVYKSLFPITQIDLSFLDISVRVKSDSGRFSFTVNKPLPESLRVGIGVFSLTKSEVLTSVAFHEKEGFL